MPPPPADLELHLFRKTGGPDGPTYGLSLRFRAPGSSAEVLYSGVQEIRFDEDVLRARRSGDYSAYGEALASQLFAEPGARSAFDQYRAVAASHGAPLHLRLFLDPSVLELHNLLWETLRLPGEAVPLLAGENVRFSRFLSARDPAPVRTPSAADVRGLVVVAAPTNLDRLRPPLAPVDAVRELQTAHDALGDIPAVDLAGPGQVNIGAIADRLRQSYDILYLVAHGILRTDGEPALCLEKADGTADWVLGQELVNAIAELSPDQRPGLVVLVSCQSAGVDGEWVATGEAALAGLGPRLAAEAGVAAVVAMQGNLTMNTAAAFTPALFARLREDGQVERAVAVARTAVAKRPDWWMPVLFTRLRDGRVWTPAPPEAAAVLHRQDFEPETVYIPAGTFLMGSDNPNEAPPHEVTLDGYRIGKYPVKNCEYQVFLEDTGRLANNEMVWDGQKPPKGKEKHPVSGVSWYDARAYCDWLSDETGRRYMLPTEAHWERAARGVDGRIYPWGNEWVEGRCHFNQEGTAAVDAYDPQNEWGCCDMVGNVREWTSTLWGETPFEPDEPYRYPWEQDRRENLDANSAIRRVYRGGAAADPQERLRCAAHGGFEPNKHGPVGKRHGFRVTLSITKAAKT